MSRLCFIAAPIILPRASSSSLTISPPSTATIRCPLRCATSPPSTPSTSSTSSTTTSRSLNADILSLALPALGALALDPLLSLIDTAFIGHLSVAALAGVGASTIILNVSFSLFNFLSISVTPLVASAIHKDSSNSNAASSIISNALLLALLIGIGSQFILVFFAPCLCSLLGASEQALPHAINYLRIRAIATPFALMAFACSGALRGFKDLKTSFFVAVIANSLNIGLDILFMFVFQWGVSGAAYATSISQVLSFLLLIYRLIKTKRLQFIHLFHIPTYNSLKPLLSAGALLTIRTLSILGTVAYATSTAAKNGIISLAAYELTRQLWVFNATILDSLAAAVQSLVASAVASGGIKRARKLADRTILLSALFGCLLAILAVLSGNRLPRLFTKDEQVIKLAVRCIQMAAICAPINGAVFALDGVLAACADYKYMARAIAMAAIIACCTLRLVAVLHGNVVAVWGALNVLMIARVIVLGNRFWGDNSPVKKQETTTSLQEKNA